MTCLLTFVIYAASYQYIKYAWLMGNLLSYVRGVTSIELYPTTAFTFWDRAFQGFLLGPMYMIDSSSLFGESRRGVSPFTPEVCASIKNLLKENNEFSKNVDYEVIRKKNYLFSPCFICLKKK